MYLPYFKQRFAARGKKDGFKASPIGVLIGYLYNKTFVIEALL